MSLLCSICGTVFATKYSAIRHMKRKHKTVVVLETGNMRCPIADCNNTTGNYRALRNHIIKEHHLTIERGKKIFTSEEKFEDWKKKMERRETCSYVRATSWKKSPPNKKLAYFHCSRSGVFISGSKGHKRLKSQGSCKMGSTCPSGLHVVVHEDETTHVVHYKTHCGHDLSDVHLNVQKDDGRKRARKVYPDTNITNDNSEITDLLDAEIMHNDADCQSNYSQIENHIASCNLVLDSLTSCSALSEEDSATIESCFSKILNVIQARSESNHIVSDVGTVSVTYTIE